MKSRFTTRRLVIGAVLAAALAGAATSAASGGTILIGSIAGTGDPGPSTSAMADRLSIPNIGAVDDAGITIYPNGPAKPPLPWVWSWGLNTFAFGGIDAAYAQIGRAH